MTGKFSILESFIENKSTDGSVASELVGYLAYRPILEGKNRSPLQPPGHPEEALCIET